MNQRTFTALPVRFECIPFSTRTFVGADRVVTLHFTFVCSSSTFVDVYNEEKTQDYWCL